MTDAPLLLVPPPSTPVDQHPAAVYLARLAPGSRPTMRAALDVIAVLASGGLQNTRTFEWSLLRYQHAAAVRSQLADQYAPATANKILSALRGVLKECWRLGLMPVEDYHRAADLAPVRGSTPQKGRALAASERKALLTACEDGTAAGTRDAALLAVLYGAGLRRAEAVALDVYDYDADAGEQSLSIKRGKGRKARIVYLNDQAAALLVAWLRLRAPGVVSRLAPSAYPDDAPLFVGVTRGDHLTERRLTPAAVRFILLKRAKAAGVAKFSPHDFRRSFVSDLLDAGADVATVQKLAGHANVATTTRYDRRGERAKRAAANLLKVDA